ncbi:GOLPH3/VPS74 family protein [Mangrovihabitans endophyticus]|uniref:Golgi phosphoprotein 3 (GPP34) n=1 Tax=Mangrovihabitans endophyticus TaxID=1751298 RepID=A0A8J3C977_9ACTN|nr:GPP34 family phosphoprotein [Mangrovihabitans endophyticus]GGL20899.1 hypothetical protein GCM10012284_64500 [Mangrovihabitans endophyticus]
MATYRTGPAAGPAPRREAGLPLHAQLYLIGHDDDTGRAHLREPCLAAGLAGALLLELVFARHVVIGWVWDGFHQRWQPRPGCLGILQPAPAGSPLLDAALATTHRVIHADPDGGHLRTWVQSFAAADCYPRVRAAMITAGLVRTVRRRRYAGLITTDTHQIVDTAYTTRARTYVRDAVACLEPGPYQPPTPPTDTTVALCGLITALGLTEYLYRNQTNRDLDRWLRLVVNRHHHPAITTMIHTVDAVRGDLAVAAMA